LTLVPELPLNNIHKPAPAAIKTRRNSAAPAIRLRLRAARRRD
jgi:hypothetical protein